MIDKKKNRLVMVRKALGLSQKEFCRGIHLSQSYYALIEGETRELNDRIIALICSKYHVSKDYLQSGRGEMFSEPLAGIQKDQLLEIYGQLDPLFRDYILLQIRQLLEVQNKARERNAAGGIEKF